MDFKKPGGDNPSELDNSTGPQRIPRLTLAKMRMASLPNTPAWCLKRLSSHKNERVAGRVAENPNTPNEVLAKLAEHVNANVRIALTENINTPVVLLLKLAVDENADVRYSLAENHNTPLCVLTELCDDENPYVVARANQTLNRLRNSTYRSFARFPYFRHRLGNLDIG